MRRRIIVITVIVLLLVIGGIAYFIAQPAGQQGGWFTSLFRDSAEQIEKWVGNQIIAIVNDHLEPELHFAQIDYQAPKTVVLSSVRLTTAQTDFIAADSLTIELAEVPRRGQPIVIQSVSLTRPAVKLIERDDGELLGFSEMVAGQGGREREDGGSTRLTDVLRIRHIAIEDGVIEYQQTGHPPMMLDQISVAMDTTPDQPESVVTGIDDDAPAPVQPADATELTAKPAVPGSDDPGWYALNFSINRAPIAEITCNGHININTPTIQFGDTNVALRLKPGEYEILPPQLQSLVKTHEVHGDLSAHLTGLLPLKQPMAGSVKLKAELADGRMAFGEFVLPIKRTTIRSYLHNNQLTITPLTAELLGGVLNATSTIRGNAARTMVFSLNVDGVDIREILRNPASDAPPKYAGIVNTEINGNMALANPKQSLSGAGRTTITEGRLVNIPVIGGLLRQMDAALGGKADHTLETNLTLNGDHIALSNIKVVAGANAARGDGEVYFDRHINFRFNGGPLERVQGLFGKIGEAIGSVTDKIVTYQVSGSLSEPKFDVRPFGIGTSTDKPKEQSD